MNDYDVSDDIQLIKELRNYSDTDLAEALNVSRVTINRWLRDSSQMSNASISAFYEFAFSKGLRLNEIHALLMKEEYEGAGRRVLFHGSKTGIKGEIDPAMNSGRNDFGKGFYCGENLEQSAMFVAAYPDSSLYILLFDGTGLRSLNYTVDTDWMLTIALFRGRLGRYEDHPKLVDLKKRVSEADYIIAPIADNRMFDIIDEFAEEQINDQQCRHCLSATDLGYQYVFQSQRSLSGLRILEHRYLAKNEKESYLERRRASQAVAADKVKAAKRNYRNEGKYIDEILK